MRIGDGDFTYAWHDDWARIPDTPTGRASGRTHGVAVLQSGDVVVFHQADPALLVFGPDGRLKRSFGSGLTGAHGLTLVREGDQEFLWVTDQDSKRVAKLTLDGETVQTIAPPPAEGKYVPTWAAVNPANGDVWVADGYGSSLVHRHDRSGKFLATLDGTEGAGKFNCPHGIAFSPAGELWIADRANRRIAIYSGEGKYLRHRDGACHSPCGFDFLGDRVVVAELFGSVKVLDVTTLDVKADLGVGEVTPNPGAAWWPPRAPEGWPNLRDTPHVKPGAFNSPHGACFAPNGDIYVVEWIIGGRITKLRKT